MPPQRYFTPIYCFAVVTMLDALLEAAFVVFVVLIVEVGFFEVVEVDFVDVDLVDVAIDEVGLVDVGAFVAGTVLAA